MTLNSKNPLNISIESWYENLLSRKVCIEAVDLTLEVGPSNIELRLVNLDILAPFNILSVRP